MNQFVMALIATMVFLTGCASTGGAGSNTTQDNGGLPEIAAYEEASYDPLPDMVTAQ